MRRRTHIVRLELTALHDKRIKTTIYWCGLQSRWLEDDTPIPPKELRKFEKFKAQQAENPWPVCQKCRHAKDKHALANDAAT